MSKEEGGLKPHNRLGAAVLPVLSVLSGSRAVFSVALWFALWPAWVGTPTALAQTALPQAQTAPPQAQTAPPQAQTAPPQAQTAPPQAQTAPPQAQTAPPQAQTAPPPAIMKIGGRVRDAPSGVKIESARVVLIQYTLGARERIREQRIEEVSPDKDGRFRFKPVTGRARGMYRIIATLGDLRTGTGLFPLARAGGTKSFELRFPRLITDRSALRVQEARIAFEPYSGGTFVTEVLHYINPTKNIIEGMRTPLEISIPAEAESLEMIDVAKQKKNHRREGSKVLVFGNLPPGRTTVAFRYRLVAGWGSLSLQKRYRWPVANIFVLSPEGLLTLKGEGFTRDEIRTFGNTRFDSWVRKEIGAGESVTLAISGLPINQSVILPWIGVFLAIMAGVVAWYWRKRLPGENEAGSETSLQG